MEHRIGDPCPTRKIYKPLTRRGRDDATRCSFLNFWIPRNKDRSVRWVIVIIIFKARDILSKTWREGPINVVFSDYVSIEGGIIGINGIVRNLQTISRVTANSYLRIIVRCEREVYKENSLFVPFPRLRYNNVYKCKLLSLSLFSFLLAVAGEQFSMGLIRCSVSKNATRLSPTNIMNVVNPYTCAIIVIIIVTNHVFICHWNELYFDL